MQFLTIILISAAAICLELVAFSQSDRGGESGAMDFAAFQEVLRQELAASEARVISKVEELLKSKRKAASGAQRGEPRRARVTPRSLLIEDLEKTVGVTRATAQALMKALEEELGLPPSTKEEVAHTGGLLKPALLIPGAGEKVFQWVIRSKPMKKQRAEEKCPEETPNNEKLSAWAAIVKEQCEEGVYGTGDKRKLPPNCKRPLKRPRKGCRARVDSGGVVENGEKEVSTKTLEEQLEEELGLEECSVRSKPMKQQQQQPNNEEQCEGADEEGGEREATKRRHLAARRALAARKKLESAESSSGTDSEDDSSSSSSKEEEKEKKEEKKKKKEEKE